MPITTRDIIADLPEALAAALAAALLLAAVFVMAGYVDAGTMGPA